MWRTAWITGSTAYELLQKAPGVVIDNNDNISLKGRGGVLVQIDGKDTRLSTDELADYLKSIQSAGGIHRTHFEILLQNMTHRELQASSTSS